ncbi:uncharacterized protein LOC105185188 isoform X2 [Harpegnathos saltator]|uniref:uncharacterized protein LOC105185188 isoform X2 n=1 Tax=Harpegnathos saltator TaxID=610380 RepID=UPI000DBEDBD9|nr:uncharacterized protein LOC105185188 isoform X2 [Harpegnathos saltator]
MDSRGNATVVNLLLSAIRSNNPKRSQIVSKKVFKRDQKEHLFIIKDILSNIFRKVIPSSGSTIISSDSPVDNIYNGKQLSIKRGKQLPVTEGNKIHSTKSQENTAIISSYIIKLSSSNITFLEQLPIKKGKLRDSNVNLVQEEINNSSTKQISQINIPQINEPPIKGTSDNLHYKNIIYICCFSFKEPNNQIDISLKNILFVPELYIDKSNYNSQLKNKFSKTNNQLYNQLDKQPNNQCNKQLDKKSDKQSNEQPSDWSNNEFSNQTDNLNIGTTCQQVFLEVSLSNEDTTHVSPTVQISVDIVGKKGKKSNQQSSIKLSIDNFTYIFNKMLKKVKIVIVGAGASGIAAASKLLQGGIDDFVILEANNRIGGRINTVAFGDNVVDLGAQWVHGEIGNVVYDLASKYNLLGSFCTLFDTSKHEFFTINGERISKEESMKALTIYFDLMKKASDDLGKAEGSFGNYFREKFYKTYMETFASYSRISELFSWIEKMECSIECSDSLSEVSAKRLTDYWECEGDSVQNWKERGYKTLFDLLMKKIPNAENGLPVTERIELKKVVTTIDYNSGKDVTVTTSDGCKYIASHVIFTASLGVLKKKHSTLFVPSLPSKIRRAIRGLCIGTVNKIFMEFPCKWWSEDTVSINLVSLEENKKLFVQKYGEEYQWLCDVFSFFVVDYQPRLLCAWIIGKYARQMETLSDTDISDGLYRLLQDSMGKHYHVVRPTRILRSKWFTDEHFQGSYTFQSMNTENLNVKPSDLAEPVVVNGKPVILFAGEATHDHYYSTVHGAVETGFREADRLLDFYQRTRDCLDQVVNNINKIRIDEISMDQTDEYDERTKIVIVGAGIAGIAAAATLQEAGCDYIICEAQDRIGGRIFSVPVGETCIELGAQYLHGDEGDLAEYCRAKNLLSRIFGTDGEGLLLRDNGCAISSGTVLACDVNDVIHDTLHNCEQFYRHKETEYDIANNESVGNYLRKNFEKYLAECNDPAPIRKMKEEVFDFKMRYLQVDNSCDSMYELSLKLWGKYEIAGRDKYQMFKQGYISLLNTLAEDISSEKLRLNSPVKSIRWLDTLPTRTTATVLVETRQGKRILADAVIVTCSLGVLKHVHEKMFDPPLPRIMKCAIENLGFGVVNKIILRYDAPWWYSSVTGFQILPSHYRPEMPQLPEWTSYITGFDVLANHTSILVGWISGEGARAVEHVPEATIGMYVTSLLSRYMNRSIPLPVDCYTSTWFSNEYIRGGYCNITTNCEAANVSTSTLSEPIWAKVKDDSSVQVPVILLAGEATHNRYFSTVHGAYETGISQAKLCLLHHSVSM